MGYATSATGDLDTAICHIYDDLEGDEKDEFADELWNVLEKWEKKLEGKS